MKKYNNKYDAYYDDEKDIWLEKKCRTEVHCDLCKGRPKKPSQIKK